MATSDDSVLDAAIPDAPPVDPAPAGPRFTHTLSTYQAIVGFVATVLSVGGTGLTLPRMLAAAHSPRTGDMAIVILDARGGRPVSNASIEILTPQDALVTTVSSDDGGQAKRTLREGQYRVRVRHPLYATTTQPVVIMKGQNTVVPVRLHAAAASAPPADGWPPEPETRQAPRPHVNSPNVNPPHVDPPQVDRPYLDPPPAAPLERTPPQAA